MKRTGGPIPKRPSSRAPSTRRAQFDRFDQTSRLGALLCLIALIGAGAARADERSHREAALLYLNVSHVPQRLVPLMQRIKNQQLRALEKWYVPSDLKGPAKSYIEEVTRLVSNEFSWNRVKDEFVDAYVSVYTEEELRGLVAFYQTRLGQKYLAKRPRLIEAGLAIAEGHVKALVPRIEKLAKRLQAKMEARSSSGAGESDR